MGATNPAPRPEKKENDPERRNVEHVAWLLWGVALFVGGGLYYVGFYWWLNPIIAATGLTIILGATFLCLIAVIVSGGAKYPAPGPEKKEKAPGPTKIPKSNERKQAEVVAWLLWGVALFVGGVLTAVGFRLPNPIIAATGLTIILGATFLFLAALIVSESADPDPDLRGELLRRFLRDNEECPSLARLQLVSWTSIVIIAFAWITLIRIFSGVPAFSGSFPPNLLGILTISTGSTVVAWQIESKKKLPEDVLERMRSWNALLDEVSTEEKMVHPSLARFQMLGWTVISIGIYVAIIFVEVQHAWTSGSAGGLTLPDLDPTLLVLMGVSQSGYLGSKYVSYNPLESRDKPVSVAASQTSMPPGTPPPDAGTNPLVAAPPNTAPPHPTAAGPKDEPTSEPPTPPSGKPNGGSGARPEPIAKSVSEHNKL